MDDSLFVSDGTNDDGGSVRIKIADKVQKEIRKVKPIPNYDNHIVYTKNTKNWNSWGDNALVHKGMIYDLVDDGKEKASKRHKELNKKIQDLNVLHNKDIGDINLKHDSDTKIIKSEHNKDIGIIDKVIAKIN